MGVEIVCFILIFYIYIFFYLLCVYFVYFCWTNQPINGTERNGKETQRNANRTRKRLTLYTCLNEEGRGAGKKYKKKTNIRIYV